MTQNPTIDALSTLYRRGKWQVSLFHARPYPRLIWLTHGQGRAIIGGARRGAGLHNALYIAPNQPFSLDPGPQTNGQVFALNNVGGGLWPEQSHVLRIRDTAQQSAIAQQFDAVKRELQAQRPMAAQAIYAHCNLINVWLHRRIADPDHVLPAADAAQRIVDVFCETLSRRYSEGLNMASYAKICHVTPTHLTRVCKERLGKSAADLVTEATLHAARELLEGGSESAKSIAQKLGFRSAAYFSRFILAHTGKTPLQLRKSADQFST